MWRTVIVNQGEQITTRDSWLTVAGGGLEQRIPVEDIYSLIIDNRSAMLSVAALTTLTRSGAHIIICDEKHIPASVILPLNHHHRPYGVLKRQLKLTQELKDALWQRIIRQKIINQYKCLCYVNVKKEKADSVLKLSEDILPGDPKNREGTAAAKYFKALFGAGFYRMQDDVTNAALNYGYSILRSAICKTLIAYGYNCALGIHHIGESNPFNLADDLIEPLRPLVDLWTDENCDNLFGKLSTDNKQELIALINKPIFIDGKKMRVRYAIDRYVSSFTSALEKGDPSLLCIPVLLRLEENFEDELDG